MPGHYANILGYMVMVVALQIYTTASWCTDYADVMRLNPTGASAATSTARGLQTEGVNASKQMVTADRQRLQNLRQCFNTLGSRYGIYPAVIAAIASRESHAGNILNGDGYSADGVHYGLMQCNVETSPYNCLEYEPSSCGHIEQFVNLSLVPYTDTLSNSNRGWTDQQELQGAIAAYDLGSTATITTWENVDEGTTNGDYSNDIIARAQHLLRQYGWARPTMAPPTSVLTDINNGLTSSPPGATGCDAVTFVSRNNWCARMPTGRTSITTPFCGVFIHHSALNTCTELSDCIEKAQQIQNIHMDEKIPNWSDVGYNFMIGGDGRVYEGRGWDLRGAHGRRHNDWTYGICFMGNFTNALPTEAALNAASNLIACGIEREKIGQGYEIFGHRNGVCTSCPGNELYAHIQTWPHFSTRNITHYCDSTVAAPPPAPCTLTTLPPATTTVSPEVNCKTLAEAGNCEFYRQCVQLNVACDASRDYPMAYGYKYCVKFSEQYGRFTNQGKQWVDEVRICLMRVLYDYIYKPGITCAQLTDIAFDSHVNCYLDSGPGFCATALNNIDALCDVYEANDFFKKFWLKAWKQVLRTVHSCYRKQWNMSGVWEMVVEATQCATDKAGSFILRLFDRRKRRSVTEELSEQDVIEFALNGDCEFWEALEDKFSCHKEFDWSISYSLLLPLCVKFKTYSGIGPSSTVGQWMHRTQECLMSYVIPLYRSSALDCLELDSTVMYNMVTCMVDSGFCELDRSDEFFLGRGIDSKGFPFRFDDRLYTKCPLTGRMNRLEKDHFHAMKWFKALSADANIKCYQQNERSSPYLYERIYSSTYDIDINFRTEN